MGLQDKMVALVVGEAWEKVKGAVGEGGQELLKNPWPLIDTFRFLAKIMEEYAVSHGIARKEEKRGA